ncbi:MAG: phosphopantetheine adenylyltransferase [Deltaproteobacteria bacterium]|nr:phosphopantetheine adenylyltransferase [Deltaproteobacteria bacterium]
MLSAALFALVGLVNFAPVLGARSLATISRMYGLDVRQDDRDLAVLLRHRAVMLGLVGGLMIYAAVNPPLQPAAAVVGFASMLSFTALTWAARPPSRAIAKVAAIDVAASFVLAIALGLRVL